MSTKIYLIGDITYKAYARFSEEMSTAEAAEPNGNIVVELTSQGGDAYVSLAFVARIRKSTSYVKICGNGYVASAAVLVLAAGDKRAMTAESWLMVHEEQYVELEGALAHLEGEMKQSRRLQNQADKALAYYSNVSAEKWAAMHKATTYLSAAECLAIGLIDEVV